MRCPVASRAHRIWAPIASAFLASAATLPTAPASAQPAIDFDTAWFTPSLIEDRGPVCAEVLAFGRRFFAGDNWLITLNWRAPVEIAGLESVNVSSLPIEQGVRYVVTGDRKIYWLDTVAPGNCGGACERRQIYVTPILPPSRGPAREDFLRELARTPAAYDHRVLRAGDVYYVLLIAEEQLQLYELTADAEWQLPCRVRLTPGNLRVSGDARLKAVLASLDALREAVRGLTRGGGDCGTMQTHVRWDSYVTEQLEELVFRPRPPRAPDRDDDATYDIDMQNLEKWALTGVSEYAALARYQEQLVATTAALTDYYAQAYDLGRDDAEAIASFGLREAISVGIRFYQYSPFNYANEWQLRAAILERRALAELRAIDVPLAAIDGEPPKPYRFPGESLLNIAVGYPEALAYLLERGADPNSPNAFGKTPLMYAAQQNALAAAELLLDAGADPNATTTWPENHCYYRLNRASMTPLHYAVRSASRELVDLLLDAGARPYISTQTRYAAEAYPLDWLRKYTSAGAAERNSNIGDDEVEALAARLAVPSPERRAAIATDLAIEAEGRYAAGDAAGAYSLLVRARQADGDNARVLSDLSLVALRSDQPGEAVGAALRLIDVTDDPALEANAWFNIGLACDRANARYTVRFNDSHPCRYASVFPFLEAWLVQPTAARVEKLDEVLVRRASCSRTREDGSLEHHIVANGVRDNIGGRISSRVYVYHTAAQVGSEGVTWSQTYPESNPVTSIARHVLGGRAITVFETSSRFTVSLPSGVLECRSAPE